MWGRPTALGLVAAGALTFTVHTTTGLVQSDEAAPAAMALTGTGPTTEEPPPKAVGTTTTSATTTAPTTTQTSESTRSSTEPSTTTTTSTEPEPAETTEEPPPEPVRPEPVSCSTELEGTEPHVAQVGHHVLTQFAIGSVGGRASRTNTSDHPLGLALDFTVPPEVGDPLADYLLAHQAEFGITYVIWKQRINSGSGWSAMEDRGSPTANHMDHVHVSFAAGADVAVTC